MRILETYHKFTLYLGEDFKLFRDSSIEILRSAKYLKFHFAKSDDAFELGKLLDVREGLNDRKQPFIHLYLQTPDGKEDDVKLYSFDEENKLVITTLTEKEYNKLISSPNNLS